jgi:hypothetical protein
MAAGEAVDWDGVTTRDVYKPAVVTARDELANAARDGAWPLVLEILVGHPGWVNTARIGSRTGYAPLHQAAWHGAGPDTVVRLLDLGAWRTLRASSGERAADLARAHGHAHLANLLEPVIRQPVPPAVLAALESRLHRLIEEESYALAQKHRLRLPQLEIMTELPAGSHVWFPVPGMYGGFRIALDGEALTVESWNRVVTGSGQRHRVTAEGTVLTEAGFV